MTGAAQLSNERCSDTLVRQPKHDSAIDDVFVGQIVGRERLGCPNIIGR
jgi:hypothetical protein